MKLVRQLWYIFTPRERIESVFLLGAMILGAGFEAFSIGLVVPFIGVLKQPELLTRITFLQPVLHRLNIDEPQKLFYIIAPGMIVLFAFKTFYLLRLYLWLFSYAMRKHVSLARQLMTGYLKAPYTLHLQRNSAEIIRVTTRSVEDFTNGFMVNLLILLGELLVLAALTSLLMFVEPAVTLGALLVLGVPTAIVYRLTRNRLAAAGEFAEDGFSSMIQWAEQSISGVKETMITGRRAFFIEQHSRYVRQFTDSLRTLTFLSAVPRFVIDTLAVSAMVAIAGILMVRGQDLQSILLILGMFALAALRLIPSMSRISSSLAQLRYRYASTDVVYRELVALNERPSEERSDEPVSLVPFRQALVLEHVSYRYPGMHRPAIDDVSLIIPKGQWIGLIGQTGAGKTTLIDLILGLLVADSGSIQVDGRNLYDNLVGWQRNIGYVPQRVYLIDDTIRRNIAFGVPEHEIDDQRVWQALRSAQVDHLVRALPGELGAVIGEHGDRLSGGERQRLGIARALYDDPEVLVIDEATANLDPGTEAAIVEAIGGLRGKKTIIVITHRLAFVRNADCIYMMGGGRLRNVGGYSDLIAKEPALLDLGAP